MKYLNVAISTYVKKLDKSKDVFEVKVSTLEAVINAMIQGLGLRVTITIKNIPILKPNREKACQTV